MKLAAFLLVVLLVGLVSARNVKRRELNEAEQEELMQNRGLLFGGLGTGTGTGVDNLVTRWERFWSAILTGRPFADTDNDGIIDKFDTNNGRR